MAAKTVYANYKKFKMPKVKISFGSSKIIARVFASFFALIAIALIVLSVIFVPTLLKAKAYAETLRRDARGVKDALVEKDFPLVKERLATMDSDLSEFESFYTSKVKKVQYIPPLKPFYSDGLHGITAARKSMNLASQTLDVLEPFSSELGLDDGSLDNKTRIFKLIEIMPQVAPDMSRIFGSLQDVDRELSYIDETRYPKDFRGYNIRSTIAQGKSLVHELSVKAPSFDKLFTVLPDLLGLNEPKTYMVFMANNYELRMSGGFHTYLVMVKMDKGVPEVVTSIDTYDIDRDKSYLVYKNVPYHLRNYLLVKRFYARDATSNSPDFKIASDEFLSKFWRVDSSMPQNFDGVIQVNNFVIQNLLKVVGPVEAGGYSVKTDQDYYINVPVKEFNADNVIMELEKIAGGDLAETIGRKDIIKVLMLSIMDKALNTPAENLGALAQTIFKDFNEKNIIIYSFDDTAEQAVEDLGYGGRIVDTPEGYDYLHVNNSNYGAGKRDWLIEREIIKDNSIENGKKVSTIKMKTVNPKSPDWWQWAPFYRDYFRFYVPSGSRLISASSSDGQELNAKEIDDLGKTAIEGFFKMDEDTAVTITIKYELPDFVNFDDYRLIIQKQPGTKGDPYIINHMGGKKSFDLLTDMEVSF